MRLAASRTFCTAGSSRPISTPMIAMTTSSSIKVKPDRRRNMGHLQIKERKNTGKNLIGPSGLKQMRQARRAFTLKIDGFRFGSGVAGAERSEAPEIRG